MHIKLIFFGEVIRHLQRIANGPNFVQQTVTVKMLLTLEPVSYNLFVQALLDNTKGKRRKLFSKGIIVKCVDYDFSHDLFDLAKE